MKPNSFLACLFAIFALSHNAPAFAYASEGAIDSHAYRCADLRELLRERETLEIKLLIGQQKYFATSAQCAALKQPADPAYVGTYDYAFCKVGYLCKPFAGDPVGRR
jgi:hypothetical protein